jgi:hypothetical protein
MNKKTRYNMRYISGGKDAQLERFTIPIKFITAERKAISNAARNIPSPLATMYSRPKKRLHKK